MINKILFRSSEGKWSHLCYCHPAFLPEPPSIVILFYLFFYHIFILFFILFLFYHIISFNFFIYFYFLSSHFCYCLPAFLPDLPSLVIFGLVRSQKSFWCKINLTFFFSPEKCNKLAKEQARSSSLTEKKDMSCGFGHIPQIRHRLRD